MGEVPAWTCGTCRYSNNRSVDTKRCMRHPPVNRANGEFSGIRPYEFPRVESEGYCWDGALSEEFKKETQKVEEKIDDTIHCTIKLNPTIEFDDAKGTTRKCYDCNNIRIYSKDKSKVCDDGIFVRPIKVAESCGKWTPRRD